MKTLIFTLAFSLVALASIRAQSSGQDYSGFIDLAHSPGAHSSNHHLESAMFSRLEREVKAAFIQPSKEMLRFKEGGLLFNALLLSVVVIGLTCFFSTFSARQENHRAREVNLPEPQRQAPSKAS